MFGVSDVLGVLGGKLNNSDVLMRTYQHLDKVVLDADFIQILESAGKRRHGRGWDS